MKFSNLVFTSSAAVVASSPSGNLRASDSTKRNLADCATTMEDIDFALYASEAYCVGKNMFPLLQSAMSDEGCSTKGRDVKAHAMVLTGVTNANLAKKSLVNTCKNYIGGSDDDNNGGGDDEDDNDTGACTSIASLNFRTIGECKNSDIKERIEEKMAAVSCSHNYSTELSLLTGKSDTDAAKSAIQDKCYGEFGCTTGFDVNGCDYRSVIDIIGRKLGSKCPHDADTELQIMTGTNNLDDAKEYLSEVCDDAFTSVATTTYTDIDSTFTKSFMDTYVDGKGFLNTETGNFQGNDSPNYPVTPESKAAGENIDKYYKNDGSSTILLNNGWGGFSSCQYNSYMCCFGRDRQSGDNNGNCANNDCGDADPGDNSNLCFTEPSNTPYFGESEDDIHCHGLAWAEDGNDLISRFYMNNFFYVSMYDHMYQRGYVEPAVDGPDDIRMCGCIEDMPKVSRSDCTQVDVDLTFNFYRGSTGFVEANTDDDPDIDFNACKGTDFDNGNNANNDLASYAVRLVAEGRMSTATQDGIFKTLLGYADPGDNENEDVCVAAYDELTGGGGGGNHPCTNLANFEINGCDYKTFYDGVNANLPNSCPHGIDKELQLLTGAATNSGAEAAINDMCSDAWDSVDQSNFKSISNTFKDGFMEDYVKGETFLNLETGNFQGNTNGSDQASIDAGAEIKAFHDGEAKSSRMVADFPSEATDFESCALNSIMCCFGRDRQFGDDNGNCNRNDCDDADPGDNSNLCYTEPSNTPFPKDSEGDVHCHGLAWADDGNDFSAQLKYNNFFYVSLYDHMYSRGYVQEMTYDQATPDVVPMCGCMEDMHPVTRSDCTELEVEQKFKFSSTSGTLKGEPEGEMEIEFNACKGTNPSSGKNANNDLASYVYKLVEEEKLAASTKDAIYQKLVGYNKPGSNSNENACRASYEDETGLTYPRN